MYTGGNMDEELTFEITVEELEDGRICISLVDNPLVKVFGATEEEATKKLQTLMEDALEEAIKDFRKNIN